jgi:hypothetical protein
MGHLSPEKRALFSLLKKVGGHMPPLLSPPPRFRGPWEDIVEVICVQSMMIHIYVPHVQTTPLTKKIVSGHK